MPIEMDALSSSQQFPQRRQPAAVSFSSWRLELNLKSLCSSLNYTVCAHNVVSTRKYSRLCVYLFDMLRLDAPGLVHGALPRVRTRHN